MSQIYAEFDGLAVEVSASMSRTPGVSPDVGQLVWRANGTLPSSPFGDLVFFIDGAPPVEVVRFTRCKLDDPREQRSGLINAVYRVFDRREEWQFPVLFGSWNVRDDNKLVIAGMAKNPQQLASLALDALGETGYDVSALPTVFEPIRVDWHYEPAAVFLNKLCDRFGCKVHLGFDDIVRIKQDGIGAVPAATLADGVSLAEEPEVGLIVNLAPDHLTAYAHDTLFESWLSLGESVAEDVDGKVKPIDQLQYKPATGWDHYSPDSDHGMACMFAVLKADTSLSDEKRDKIKALYRRDVFRRYRVTGFAGGATGPPGFPQYDNTASGDYALIEVLDDGTVNLISSHAMESDAIAAKVLATPAVGSVGLYIVPPWVNFGRIGFTDAGIGWNLVTINANGSYTGTSTFGARFIDRRAAVAGRANEDIIAMPNQTVFDYRLIIPLEESRVESGISFNGERKELKAEVVGKFRVLNKKLQARYGQRRTTDETTNRIYWGDFSIDKENATVLFDQPMFRVVANNREVAELYLRTGYRLRLSRYGNIWHRNYTVSTGSTRGTANGVVPRVDLQELNIQQYTDAYLDVDSRTTVASNTVALDGYLADTLTEAMKKYQNLQAPQRRVYTPISAIDTDGVVVQVQYTCGAGQFGFVIASVGQQHDRSQPSAVQKQERLQQKVLSFRELNRFAREPENE
jgi:hypothetical protein